jgi:transaldolase/glucose-6-phosphate isomerase
MVHACMPWVPIDENPGVVLGSVLGVGASQFGRDKITLVCSPAIAALGGWLEQLIAESTGKEGRGLLPIDREPLGPARVYGDDRIFVYLRLRSAFDAEQDAAVAALERGGHPVVRLAIDDEYGLGEEFFRWEMATAVAGAVIGVNPFDQPDVEASKIAARKLTTEFEETGRLPPEQAVFVSEGIKLFADEKNAGELEQAVSRDRTLAGYLRAHMNRIGARDYFALLAYINMTDAHMRLLQVMRHQVRDARRVATCVEFGPRFLHSTGQFYKGGPNSGVFLQITCDDAVDLAVPGHRYTFGVVKAAQARGDFEVLATRGRRALRVHVGVDINAGLSTLQQAFASSLQA